TSEVKPLSADDSVVTHAKVGHCQTPNTSKKPAKSGFFCA
ncbi:MAG: hypothetical protein RIQ52_1577, partial [Pseudomonadota bacterium]